jgi:hemolysin activation/secretion protein
MKTPALTTFAALLLAALPARAAAQDGAPAFVLPKQATPAQPAVTARHIRFRGNTVLASEELDKVAAPYLGRPLDAGELESLRLALTQRYIAAGYVNSGAVLSPQAVEGDVLTIDIVEGRLGMVRVRGMERLRDDYLVSRLLPDASAPFNMDALRERYAMVLGDPLFERLNARLIPGAKPGDAVLDIDVQRARPYQLSAFVNNYRPPSIGSVAAGVKGTVRNLSGMGDALDASVQGGGSPRASVGWSMPLSRATALTMQWDHGQSSVVEEPLRVLDIESTLDSKDIGISHAFTDTLQRKLVLGLGVSDRRNSTTLAGLPFSFTPGEPDGTTKVRAWRLWKEAVLRTPQQVLALRSTLSATRNNTLVIAGLPPGGLPLPPRHALLWQGQGQYARQVFDNGAQLVVRANMQLSSRPLVALDRMAIGGVGTVRGFRENQLVRDRGAVVNVELDMPVLSKGADALNVALVPFVDAGRGANKGEHGESLASFGVAARLRWSGLMLDLALARRAVQPDSARGNGSTLQDKGVHAQLSYKFF